MATTTPNFGWPVPTSTDLVKDGATAIEGLGDAIDASLLDLKGGTSGQVLAKNSNTDMDFIWVTDAAGDITGVTAGTGISGGGTSGTVTVTNSMATEIDAKGDLIAGTGADAFARLAVGANDTVLTADSTTATGLKWAAAAAGGGWTSIASGSLSGSSLSLTSISGSYKNLMLVLRDVNFTNSTEPCIRLNGNSSSGVYSRIAIVNDGSTGVVSAQSSENRIFTTYNTPKLSTTGTWIINITDYANTTSHKIVTCNARYISGAVGNAAENIFTQGSAALTAAVTQIEFFGTVNFTAGTYILYGGN
jgi:hypothetical protein